MSNKANTCRRMSLLCDLKKSGLQHLEVYLKTHYAELCALQTYTLFVLSNCSQLTKDRKLFHTRVSTIKAEKLLIVPSCVSYRSPLLRC